jgi:hypothetical protein
MLKKPITYEDFDGNTVTEDLYFNLTQTEVMGLLASYGGAEKMQKELTDAVRSQDLERMLDEFKKIVLLAYGRKSEDGKRFIKSEQEKEEFTQTAAYDALFTELTTVEDAFPNFLNAVIPAKMLKMIQDQDKPLPPVAGAPSS